MQEKEEITLCTNPAQCKQEEFAWDSWLCTVQGCRSCSRNTHQEIELPWVLPYKHWGGPEFFPMMYGQVDNKTSDRSHCLHVPWRLTEFLIQVAHKWWGLTLWVSEKAQQCDTIVMGPLDIVMNISNWDIFPIEICPVVTEMVVLSLLRIIGTSVDPWLDDFFTITSYE